MNETLTAQAQPALLERPPIVRPEVTDELMADIAARIVAEFHPYRIILFGSYAYGTPHAESDVDLLVVMEKATGQDRYVHALYDAARIPKLCMDILAYSPAELETRLAMGDFFIKEILERGRMLYDCGKLWKKPEITIVMSLFEEWIGFAEEDFKGAKAMNSLIPTPLTNLVCYHAEQCAEKYFKAFLVFHNVAPPRTHDLEELLNLCVAQDAELQTLDASMRLLNPYTTRTRYPGSAAFVADGNEAILAMDTIRDLLRQKLNLETGLPS